MITSRSVRDVQSDDNTFSTVDLERAVAAERRSRILNVAPEEARAMVELSSPIDWLVSGSALYHYTTPRGLIGILVDKKIWATSLWHMNDSSELSYARDIYRQVLLDFARHNEGNAQALEALYLIESELLEQHALFAACFCQDGDLLSQWREYGSGIGGFALGMHLGQSLEGIDGWEQVSVVYDVERQFERLNEFFVRACQTLEEHPEPASGEPWPQLVALQTEALLIMASLKHPAFAEEREVRLVQWRHRSYLHGIQWRATQNVIVPYVELALSHREDPRHFGRPPVVDLVIGPTNDVVLAVRSLELLLEQYGYTFRMSESVRVRLASARLRAL